MNTSFVSRVFIAKNELKIRKLPLWIILILLSFPGFVNAQKELPYLNPKLSVEKRAEDIVSRLTLKEKVSQMVYDAPAIKRLGIPAYNWWDEGLHGVARNGIATVFPQSIGLAATWNKALMYKVASAISDEARAKYNDAIEKGQRGIYQGLTFWSPNINIFRDPRWGRGMETYGEDPYLTGQMAVQFIKGMQGNNARYFKTIATAKHYAVHSGPEPTRHTIDINVSDYDLHETYLPAFKASVVNAGVFSIMCAYNSFRGNACCSNDPLLNEILRDRWGFKGYVVSDCGAIQDIYEYHKQAKDASDAAAKALLAGTDLNCGDTYDHLTDAIKKGLVSEAAIDTSVKRLFTARIKLGMFDPPSMVPYSKINMSIVDSKLHQELALKAAEESIVLLRNDKTILPLKMDIKSIAVIGPNADDPEILLANYHGFTSHPVTPLDGIKKKAGRNIKIYYARGCNVADNMPSLKLVASEYLFTSKDKNENGLTGEYFNNHQLKGRPVFSRVDKEINFDWWNGKPRKDFPNNDFGVRWTGYLVPPKTGEYYLGGFGFNGYKIFVDDSLFLDYFNEHEPHDNYKKIFLAAGKAYKIKVEFSEVLRFAVMHLIWSIPQNGLLEKAVDAAKKSDAVILCMGLSPRLEGEEMKVNIPGFKGGDRMTLNLPGVQEDLIKKISALGKPVILVLLNGSAVSIDWENENIPGIIESWYGGEAAGDAIADVIFGNYNPGGKLPVTFYKSVNQLPPFDDYNMQNRTYRYFKGEALYPFGYGLSYTTFKFSNLAVAKNTVAAGDSTVLTVDVSNTGKMRGDEVVQLYVKAEKDTIAIKTLKGFERVSLNPGETRKVKFEITPADLKRWISGKGFVVEPDTYHLLVGSSSADKDLQKIDLAVK